MRRITWLCLAAALLCGGCGRPARSAEGEAASPETSARGEELVIISPHWEGIRYEFGHAFERWYEEETGHTVTVDWRDFGGTSDDVKYIRSSFAKSPQGIGIDLFFGGGIPPYEMLAEEDLFEPYRLSDELLRRVPPHFPGGNLYDPAFRYYGTVLSGFGILYNREVLRRLGLPEPESWTDLASPEAFTWVGMGDPRSSGSALMVFEIILQAYGWDEGWDVITRMGGNIRYFTKASSAIPKDVALGEIAYGGAIDFYARTAIARHGADRLGFVLPRGKTVVNPDPIAILKGAPHPELAQAFVRFVMSEAGQKLWFLPQGAPGGPQRYRLLRMPIMPELYESAEGRRAGLTSPFDWTPDFVYDGAKATARRAVLPDLLGVFVIDTQHELAPAWKAVIKAGLTDEVVRELSRMPVSEEGALALADRWGDPEFRVLKLTEWTRFAVRKYRRVHKQTTAAARAKREAYELFAPASLAWASRNWSAMEIR